jgi:hypothetical protein
MLLRSFAAGYAWDIIITTVCRGWSAVRKAHLLRHFILEMIIVPRQARDKYRTRENPRRDAFFAGIRALQCLEGEAIWQAAAEGRWSTALGCAALAVVDKNNEGSYSTARDTFGTEAQILRACVGDEPAVFLIEFAVSLCSNT